VLMALLWSCTSSNQGTESEESESAEVKLGAKGEISEGQRVFFKNLSDGDEVASPFRIEMGVEGMVVEPAGELAKDKGHHHLLINHDSAGKGSVIPTDSTHLHFGKGQIEKELVLRPGEYQLTLQFADGFHRSYGKQLSASVTIRVVEADNN